MDVYAAAVWFDGWEAGRRRCSSVSIRRRFTAKMGYSGREGTNGEEREGEAEEAEGEEAEEAAEEEGASLMATVGNSASFSPPDSLRNDAYDPSPPQVHVGTLYGFLCPPDAGALFRLALVSNCRFGRALIRWVRVVESGSVRVRPMMEGVSRCGIDGPMPPRMEVCEGSMGAIPFLIRDQNSGSALDEAIARYSNRPCTTIDNHDVAKLVCKSSLSLSLHMTWLPCVYHSACDHSKFG